jgi:hypothetical protein
MLTTEDAEARIKNIRKQIDEANDKADKLYHSQIQPIMSDTQRLNYELTMAINDYLNARFPGGQWENCATTTLGSLNFNINYFENLWYKDTNFISDSIAEGYSDVVQLVDSVVKGFPLSMKYEFWKILCEHPGQ